MILSETNQILDYIAAADGRNLNEQTYVVWFEALQFLDFATGQEAARRVVKDATIQWPKPKDLLAHATRIFEERAQDERRERALTASPEPKGSPMPVCEHGKGLLYCDLCCHQAAINAGLIPNKPYKVKQNL
jgi:hypothetical protein